MEKQILNFTVNEQILVCENPIKISTNKVNYIQASFDLGENWDGFDSVRAVWFNDFNCISTVLDSLGNCVVPFEVMKRKGNVKVNLVGSISEDDVLTDRLTSYPVVAVIVDCTAQITGANTSPITPSEYEQFVAAVHEDAERAEAGATASEQSATESANSASASASSATDSANSATASANSASASQTYANNAELHAHNAEISAQNASESATDAEGYAGDAEDARDTILGMRATANTLSEGSDATASYSNGLLTLGIPRGNTGAKGDKGDRGDVGATPNLSIGTVTTLEPNEDATATISGTAEEPILSFGIPKGDTGEVSLSELEDATVVQTLSDNTPYNYRRTNGGNGAGVREYDEIVGASVGWCQIARNNAAPSSRSGITVTKTDDSFTLDGTSTGFDASGWFGLDTSDMADRVGHKVLVVHTLVSGSVSDLNAVYITRLGENIAVKLNQARILTVQSGARSSYSIVNGTVCTNAECRLQVVDLTLFNSQIADYVYSLEQSTAGSGVAWLKTHFPRLFDNGYQPFDSGSIKSVSGLTAHEMVGVNQFKGNSTDSSQYIGHYLIDSAGAKFENNSYNCYRIKVLPNTAYCMARVDGSNLGTAANKRFIDASENFISADVTGWNATKGVFTTPANCRYFEFSVGVGSTYNLCINLSDTSINGQYFPYEKHTYPLDSSVTLRGKYKLDANNNLYADGDVWSSDGQITRVLAEDDLGSLDWKAGSQSGTFYANLTHAYPWNANVKMLCGALTFDGVGNSGVGYYGNNKTIRYYYRTNYDPTYQVYVKHESATSVSDLATLLAGAKLVYPLDAPTTETAPTYENPQWCDSHGTEEYVGSELPVGHSTDYPMTMVDCADGLGNGTYEARLTIANGVKTFTWQSV